MTKRLYGIDLLRLILIPPIIILHVWNFLIGEPHVTFSADTSLYPFFEKYFGNGLGHAGIFVFCISFFLFGIKRGTLLKLKLRDGFKIFVLGGAMVSSQFSGTLDINDPEFFIWDIFSYVLLSFVIVSFLARIENKKTLLALLGASILLFFIPVETYSGWYGWPWPEKIRPIFVATVTSFGPNGWFIWPWVGLPIGFYSLGRLYANGLPNKIYMAPLAIGMALLLLGPVAKPIVLGTQFYDFAFWQAPLCTLARLFIFTGALLWLSQIKWGERVSYLSYLQWNKNFWLCYILHIGLIDAFSDHKDLFLNNMAALNWLWLVIFVGIEILAQGFFFNLGVIRWLYRNIIKRLITHSG